MGGLIFLLLIILLVIKVRSDNKKAVQQRQQQDHTLKDSLIAYYQTLQTKHERAVIERFAEQNNISLSGGFAVEQIDEAWQVDPQAVEIQKSIAHAALQSSVDSVDTWGTDSHNTPIKQPNQKVAHSKPVQPIDSANYLLFFGALLIVVALIYFSRTTLEMFGPAFRFTTLIGIVGVFYAAGWYLYKTYQHLKPAGATFLWIAVCGAFVIGGSLYQDVLGEQNASVAWLVASGLAAGMIWGIWRLMRYESVQYAGFLAGLSCVLALQTSFGLPVWMMPVGAILYSAFLLWCGRGSAVVFRVAHTLSTALVPLALGSALLQIVAQELDYWVAGLSLLSGAAYYILYAWYGTDEREREKGSLCAYGLAVLGAAALGELAGGLTGGIPMILLTIGAWAGLIEYSQHKSAKNKVPYADYWSYISLSLLAVSAFVSPAAAWLALFGVLSTVVLVFVYAKIRDTTSLVAIGVTSIIGSVAGSFAIGYQQEYIIGAALSFLGIAWLISTPLIVRKDQTDIALVFAIGLPFVGGVLLSGTHAGWLGIVAALWSTAALFVVSARRIAWLHTLAVTISYCAILFLVSAYQEYSAVGALYAGILTVVYGYRWLNNNRAEDLSCVAAVMLAIVVGSYQLISESLELPVLSVLGWLLISGGSILIWISTNKKPLSARANQEGDITVHEITAVIAALSVILASGWWSRLLVEAGYSVSSVTIATCLTALVWAAGMAWGQTQPSAVLIHRRFSSLWRYASLIVLVGISAVRTLEFQEKDYIWPIVLFVTGCLVAVEGRISKNGSARYGGSAVAYVATLSLLYSFGLRSIHVFSHVSALYFLGLAGAVHYFRKDTSRVQVLLVIGLLSAFVPLAIQGIDGNGAASLALLCETALGLSIGAILRNRTIMLTSGITLGISLTYRLSAYIADIPAWIWYFVFGAGFIGLAVYLISRQEKK